MCTYIPPVHMCTQHVHVLHVIYEGYCFRSKPISTFIHTCYNDVLCVHMYTYEIIDVLRDTCTL